MVESDTRLSLSAVDFLTLHPPYSEALPDMYVANRYLGFMGIGWLVGTRCYHIEYENIELRVASCRSIVGRYEATDDERLVNYPPAADHIWPVVSPIIDGVHHAPRVIFSRKLQRL